MESYYKNISEIRNITFCNFEKLQNVKKSEKISYTENSISLW